MIMNVSMIDPQNASRNDGTFSQGTDATLGDGFAPLGPPMLPWDNSMVRGQTPRRTHGHCDN